MRVFEDVPSVESRLVSTTCNKCGAEYADGHEGPFAHVSHRFGYGSLRDQDEISFDLCEACLMAFAGTFKIGSDYTCPYAEHEGPEVAE